METDLKIRVRNFLITLHIHMVLAPIEYYKEEIQRLWDLKKFKSLASSLELTKDGKPHIQCYVSTANATTGSALIKVINEGKEAGIHWDVRPQTYKDGEGSAVNMWRYCTNANGDKEVIAGPICFGQQPQDPKEAGKAGGAKGGKMEQDRWKEIKSAIIEDRREDIPFDVVLRHGKSFKFIREFYAAKEQRLPYTDWIAFTFKNYTGPTEGVLTNSQLLRMQGLFINLEPITEKKRHLWIWTRESNYGKSGFMEYVAQRYRGLIKVGSKSVFDFWDEVRDEHEFLLLDEHNSHRIDYDNLNAICDGTSQLRIHGSTRQSPFKYVFVCSNKPLAELYPNMNHLLYARFIEYDLSIYMDPYKK